MQRLVNTLGAARVRDKIELIEESVRAALQGVGTIPEWPSRDVQVVAIRALPPKPGLSNATGQARLLHDLANIELQAMELGLRTLVEYPEAPESFRRDLATITLEEAAHLELTLEAIRDLGHEWGDWPVHLGLWQAARAEEDLLDRIVLVHRYLEGSGLDAGETILRRLKGVRAARATEVVQRIQRDEVAHVMFGSDWYRRICRLWGLDPADDFRLRLNRMFARLPRRLEPLARDSRQKAGFEPAEMTVLEELRDRWRTPSISI